VREAAAVAAAAIAMRLVEKEDEAARLTTANAALQMKLDNATARADAARAEADDARKQVADLSAAGMALATKAKKERQISATTVMQLVRAMCEIEAQKQVRVYHPRVT